MDEDEPGKYKINYWESRGGAGVGSGGHAGWGMQGCDCTRW